MDRFKDMLKVVAVALLVASVWKDSVAWAIAAGALYGGGFGDRFTWWPGARKPAPVRKLHAVKDGGGRETETGKAS